MSTQAKIMTVDLLTEESKRTLVGYHKVQMKRDQLINPAEEGLFCGMNWDFINKTRINLQLLAIIPLLDLMEEVRGKWKYAEDRLRAAEERSERFESYNM